MAVRASRGPGRPRSWADRGSVTLEIAILFPALMLLTFGVIQGALWYHARTVALAAASDGLRAGTVQHGTEAAAVSAARSFLTQAGGDDVLQAAGVVASVTPRVATITVSGHSISLLPGVPGPSVSQVATGPVERFTTAVTP